MTKEILFYVKTTPLTPNNLIREFKNNQTNKLFIAIPTIGSNYVVFNNNKPTRWTVHLSFNYIQLYWTSQQRYLMPHNMRLKSGLEVIIIRPVIRGFWLMIIILIRCLNRVRTNISKKKLYLLSVRSQYNTSNLRIFAGNGLIKETIYYHVFKKKRIN